MCEQVFVFCLLYKHFQQCILQSSLVPRRSDFSLEEGRGGTPGTHCCEHAFNFQEILENGISW